MRILICFKSYSSILDYYCSFYFSGAWQPRPEDIMMILDKLEQAKGGPLPIKWICPGRRAPDKQYKQDNRAEDQADKDGEDSRPEELRCSSRPNVAPSLANLWTTGLCACSYIYIYIKTSSSTPIAAYLTYGACSPVQKLKGWLLLSCSMRMIAPFLHIPSGSFNFIQPRILKLARCFKILQNSASITHQLRHLICFQAMYCLFWPAPPFSWTSNKRATF